MSAKESKRREQVSNEHGEYVPAHSIEVEQLVLGSVLISSNNFAGVRSVIDRQDFYRESHRLIWDAILAYDDICDGRLPDGDNTILVEMILEDEGKLDTVGGRGYFADLRIKGSYEPKLVAVSAAELRKKRILRDGYVEALAVKTACADKENPEDMLSFFKDKLDGLSLKLPGSIFESVKDLSERVIENIIKRKEEEHVQGLPSGLNEVDDLFGGFRGGQLVILGGRTRMGKTQLGLNLCHKAVMGGYRKPVPVVFLSLEMSKEDITERLLSQLSRVPLECIRKGYFQQGDLDNLQEGLKKLQSIGLTIWDETDRVRSVQQIETRIQSMAEKPAALIIDYLQIMDEDAKSETRNLALEKIMLNLKRLAIRLNIPIVVLSQVSRECEKRNNKRPGLLDLRDSGAIEQNADIVIFLYREVVYKPSVHPNDVAELIVEKHRNGPTRTLYVGFNASTGTFWDLAEGYVPQYTSDEEDDFSPQKKKRQKGSTAAAHNSMES